MHSFKTLILHRNSHWIFVLFLFLAGNNLIAQDYSVFWHGYSEEEFNKKGSRFPEEFFIPPPDFPVQVIRLNFIFLQRDDGSGNFQKDNQEHMKFLDDVEKTFKNFYSNIKPPPDSSCYTGGLYFHLRDSRIRFKVKRLFIRDTQDWNNKGGNLCPGYSSWYLAKRHKTICNDTTLLPAINVFFSEDAAAFHQIVEKGNCSDTIKFQLADCSMMPFNRKNEILRVHMLNEFTKYNQMKNCVPGFPPFEHLTWKEVYQWQKHGMAKCIAHEIGHALGLHHNNSCKANLMHSGHFNYYISPAEIGLIHRTIIFYNFEKYLER